MSGYNQNDLSAITSLPLGHRQQRIEHSAVPVPAGQEINRFR